MADVAAEATVFRGDAGLRGDTGRAIYDGFDGEDGATLYSLIGEWGRVLELWDFGERTLPGWLVRETVRAPVAAFALFGFFCTGRLSSCTILCSVSLSLSAAMIMSEVLRFLPRGVEESGCWTGRTGDGSLVFGLRGANGRVRSWDFEGNMAAIAA